jgi:hypothetical protein
MKQLFVGMMGVLAACHSGPADHNLRAKAAAGPERNAANAMWSQFSVDVAHPPTVANTTPDGQASYTTSVVYEGTTAYRVYLKSDGTQDASAINSQRPAGTFRNVNLIINHPNTDIADVYPSLWLPAQSAVNDAHAALATQLGLSAPIVTFQFTNLLLAVSDITDPSNADQVTAYLDAHGYPQSSYDIITVLDLDPSTSPGGYTHYGGNMIHLGWFLQPVSGPVSMSAEVLKKAAEITYGLEMGHVWGWENDWDTSSLTGANLLLPWANPSLFGWTDTNGNGVPEILDAHPYQ